MPLVPTVLALWLTAAAQATPPPGPASLTVTVDGLDTRTGHVIVVLFQDADAFPDDPAGALDSRRAPADADAVTVTFEGLAPGTYALFAFHDVNANGDLDVRRVIPIPKEPLAASRDAKGRFGPPRFEDAAFVVPAGPHTEVLHLSAI